MWLNVTALLPTHIGTNIEWPALCSNLLNECSSPDTETKVAAITSFCKEVLKASWTLWKVHKTASITRWKTLVQEAATLKNSSKLFKLCTQDTRAVSVEQEKTFNQHEILCDAVTNGDKLLATQQRYSTLYSTNNFKCPPYFIKSHLRCRDQPTVQLDMEWKQEGKEGIGYQAYMKCKSDCMDWNKIMAPISEAEFNYMRLSHTGKATGESDFKICTIAFLPECASEAIKELL
jgi:hypothetical protein